jgi:hypothetical protein
MANNDYIEIDLEFVYGTEDALLLSDGDAEVWIPMTQIKDAEMWHRYTIGDNYTWEIKQWILEEKGLL